MKTTDKTPETVKAPTIGERLQIFMQYSGQHFNWEQHGFKGKTEWVCSGFYCRQGCETITLGETLVSRGELPHVSVLVKPLGGISEEDAAIICSHRYGSIPPNTEWDKKGLKQSVDIIIQMITSAKQAPVHQKTIDYLRSRGYALPYQQYSVDDLVAAGIFKIIK